VEEGVVGVDELARSVGGFVKDWIGELENSVEISELTICE
jgi:hypothetical protein